MVGIDQIAIPLLGAGSICMTQSPHASVRRWACIVGVLGQPFWFYTAISHQQWGVTIAAVLYTLGWFRGIYTHWIRAQ